MSGVAIIDHSPEFSRPNSSIAHVVDAGILMEQTEGEAAAAEFLRKKGVPFRVIVRVLAEPLHRRHASAQVEI